jgi:hypothetical protein
MELSVKQRQVLDKFMAAPRPTQEAIIAAFGDLFKELKGEWEARPQNQGKTATYRKLWDEFAGQVDEEDPLVQWTSESPSEDAEVEDIDHFDARGMFRVYGRGDHFGRHSSFHMDIWMTRDGRLMMRCWSLCADIGWRSFEIKGVDPVDIPERDKKVALSDSWVPKAVRRAYDQWIDEGF